MAFTDDIKTEGQFWRRCVAALENLVTGQSSGSSVVKVADAQGDLISVSTSEADGHANATNRLKVSADIGAFNGSTWDRLRSGITGAVSSVVGYLNTLPAGKFNSTPVSLTNGQFIELQLDQAGALKSNLDQYGIVLTSNTITRPADTTAYVSGDLVANSTTAGSVTPFSFASATRVAAGTGEIQAIRLYKSGTSLTNANFRVHFYRLTMTPSNGDNGAWLTPYDDYIGSFDVTMDKVFTNGSEGAGLPTVGMLRRFTLPSGTTLFALIEARGAYTPTSGETFSIRAEISRY